MKKMVIFLIVSFCITSAAYGHPPSDIKITYDSKARVLKAVIMHNVSDVKKHFIYKIDVSLNGKEIISHAISRQNNNINQVVSYLIPDANAGDKLSVEGYCNISGKLEKGIIVPK